MAVKWLGNTLILKMNNWLNNFSSRLDWLESVEDSTIEDYEVVSVSENQDDEIKRRSDSNEPEIPKKKSKA